MLVVIATVSAVGLIQQRGQEGPRIYTNGRSTISLRADGTFRASLPHGVVRNGTYSEVSIDGIITVAFVEGGITVNGTINGNVLTIPNEWDDGHGHPRNYILRS